MHRLMNGVVVGLTVCCAGLLWMNWTMQCELLLRLDSVEERLEEIGRATATLAAVENPALREESLFAKLARQWKQAWVQSEVGAASVHMAYPIKHSDILFLDVASPHRPIAGERLVRQDGTIDLGYYGQISVAGLTPIQAQERIHQRLKEHGTTPAAPAKVTIAQFSELQ